ncbi:MAG TPA: ATP synthase F1 subunit gamma [Candidatus Borkfalkia faecavium]|uniref:ATP synthase gamma chain n=1 Tax=Candidatus Borkfalkia faecavium TaxID=2838508 RepID=A0A9D1VZP0_9FIRM|nr:ATP synthase F1 subunit gamma [Candidatus Borkfalkia faecavium]
MADIAELKHRIKSIQDTHQITKAMELISVAKMRKAMLKQAASSVYFDRVRATLKDIMLHSTDIRNAYVRHRPDTRAAYIVIAGDKGLAGAFNNNVLNLAWQHIQTRPVHYVITIGQMARSFFESRDQAVDLEFTHAVTSPTLHDSRGIMRDILDLYDRNLMDEVYVVFTRMISSSVHEPTVVKLLPIEAKDIEVEAASSFRGEICYDPSPSEVLDILVPQYLVGMIYSTLIHSAASEHAARMMAMSNANKNADKMLDSLSLEYNRLRQSAITTELLDLSSGRFFSDTNTR